MSSYPRPVTDSRRPPAERRKARAYLGPCPTCETNAEVRAVSRTDYFVYARCASCGTVWSVPKPLR